MNLEILETLTSILCAIIAFLSVAVAIDLYVKGNKLKNEKP